MKKNKRKAIIDDGMNPELVKNADFDGYLGIPIIKKPEKIIIPKRIIPFNYINRATSTLDAICFNKDDTEFSDILIHPELYVDALKDRIFITPDCSLYRDMPLAAQITNVYRNRAIGVFLQNNGVYVIPQVRWGNSLTYTTSVLPEKVAFLGVPQNSIVAIGTYGCVQSRKNKEHFKKGLESMLTTLEPKTVLVYGAMPDYIFNEYINYTNFIKYPDWDTFIHGGDQ